MLTLLLLLLPGGPPDEPLKLGAGQTWYTENTAQQQSLEGILDYQVGSGRIGIPAGYASFRVVRKDAESNKVQQFAVHAPGFESLLALNVGQRVLVEAKIVAKGEGDKKVEELWIGTLKPLGSAPLNVFTELKPIARSNKFQPTASQMTDDAAKLVIRNGKDAAKAIGFGVGEPDAERQATNYLAQQVFAIKTIDWKTQMVIYMGNAFQGTRNRLTKIEILRIDVHEKGITVHWRSEQGIQRNAQAYSTDTVLVPRVDGEVTFKHDDTKKPTDEKKDKAPEKPANVPPGVPVK